MPHDAVHGMILLISYGTTPRLMELRRQLLFFIMGERGAPWKRSKINLKVGVAIADDDN